MKRKNENKIVYEIYILLDEKEEKNISKIIELTNLNLYQKKMILKCIINLIM